jgi:hypothetical protein
LGLIVLSGSALAQQSVIDHCKQTSSDADRIACLEAALLGKDLQAAPETQTQVDPPSMELDAGPADDDVEPAGIGASQVVARNQTREEQLESLEKESGLIVASYDTVPYEKLLVTLENGQVWRQIKGDTQKIRVDLKRNQTVDIEESSLSGYKMHLNEMRRTVRVERVQ